MGDIPRIELFARERVDGWDCYGDQLPNTIQKELSPIPPKVETLGILGGIL